MPVTSARIRYWAVVVLLIPALKQFYSTASAAQLQWQLYPLVLLLETFADLNFELDANYQWQDDAHRISIVKSCAGVNFLIISLLGYFWTWRHHPLQIRLIIRVLVSAWLTTLLANTLRILLSLHAQAGLAEITGLSDASIHRFIGITVYFLCLWAQLSAFRLQNFSRMAPAAVLIYLSIALLLPWLRACWLGLIMPGWQHAIWVVSLPTIMAVLSRMLRNTYNSPVRPIP